jgi:arabinogalactan endo-1,4-beta-galactosidase
MRQIQLYFCMMIMTYCIGQSAIAKEFLIGADISALPALEKTGAVYLENGKSKDLIDILKDNGFNTVRMRLFVNPNKIGGVTNDLPYTLDLAKRAKAAGMKILLNFHYSDTWADPQQQIKPAVWEKMPFEELKQTVQGYTVSVIEAFKKENVLPDIVQIGNEITPGMLWPDGKVSAENDNEIQWEKFTALLKAGIAGVRSAAPDSKIKIMIHIDQGGKKSVSEWFFSKINKYQVQYDIIGVSYYPWWHGTIENLKENLNYIATDLQKDVVVVETAYPHSKDVDWHGHPPAGKLQFPLTPKGQYDMLRKVTKTLLETPDNRGIGVFYWFPESVPVGKHKSWMAGACALFNSKGNTLPGIHAFADAAGANAKKEK